MKADKYVCQWLDSKYRGSKEIGDWTPEDVIQFAEDFAQQSAQERYDKAYQYIEDCRETGSDVDSDKIMKIAAGLNTE